MPTTAATFELVTAGLRIVACVRPSIIWIVADDTGHNDVSFTVDASSAASMPNIQALASKGIVLDSFYTSPICSPTRSALMTGR